MVIYQFYPQPPTLVEQLFSEGEHIPVLVPWVVLELSPT